jgi:hypothetical protein
MSEEQQAGHGAVAGQVERGVGPLCDRLRDAVCDETNLREKAADKLEKLDALLRAMQADARTYLTPGGGCGADWFVSRMLWHLDGPEQRAAQGVEP